MAKNEIICKCNNVSYLDIRIAMTKGARTLSEVKEATGAASMCNNCVNKIESILTTVCGCNNVTLKEIVYYVNNGKTHVEEIGELTGAGVECGKCKMLIENIIKLKR